MRRIVFIVVSCHLLTLGVFLIQREKRSLPTTPPLHVKTVHLKEPTPQKQAPQQIATKPKPKPQPTAPSKPKPKPTPRANDNTQALTKLMQESLATLDHTSSLSEPTQSPTQTLPQIGKLASEARTFERNYAQELVAYLEELLELPEAGQVKITLTLNRGGVVEKVVVTTASSPKNRTYIETILPTLSLPPFGKQYKGEATHTFTISFSSENSH